MSSSTGSISGVPQPAAKTMPVAPLGTRIRKDINYVRHYQPFNRAVLESGDLIQVEPSSTQDFGFYLVKPNTAPEILPMKTVNIATRWSTVLPHLVSTAAPSQIETLVRTLDVGRMELAHYRIACLDAGFQCIIAQPTASFRFADKVGARRMSYGNTMYWIAKGSQDYGALPELFCFQDDTPLDIIATSTNMNEDTYWARLAVIGYKYQLLKVRPPDPENEPRVVMTIRVGEKQ